MAEALGVAASIIAILQVIQTITTYVKELKGADEERNNIFKEATSLYHFLDALNTKVPDQVQPGDIWFKTLKSFKTPDGPLEQIKLLLDRLTAKLKSAKAFKKFGQALFWPFQKGEVKEILDSIEHQKSIIGLALENDHM